MQEQSFLFLKEQIKDIIINLVFPVVTFEASLLENLLRLDTMITEETAKESSNIDCLRVTRLLYGSIAFLL